MSPKQLLILSGKGGTGKTTIASAFIKLSQARAYADCDVDAPNLHIIAGWTTAPTRTDYYGLPRAEIDPEVCIGCDLCRQHCRFGAILVDESYRVDPFACEGCGVCAFVCPHEAIVMVPHVDGELMLYADGRHVFSTAKLQMGSGTSGLLVTEVKKQMKEAAGKADLAIIDGSPGIGCPVIASLSGVDLVLVVAEPSVSGISDMERIIDTAAKFGVKTLVCVNKYDTNPGGASEIEEFCQSKQLPFLDRIPFDTEAINLVNQGLSVVDVDCKAGRAIRNVYEQTMDILFRQQEAE